MSDLISRKAVIALIKSRLNSSANGTLENQRLFSLLKSVEELPAAYDVTDVLGDLENRKALLKYAHISKSARVAAEQALSFAIETVKAGGVNE